MGKKDKKSRRKQSKGKRSVSSSSSDSSSSYSSSQSSSSSSDSSSPGSSPYRETNDRRFKKQKSSSPTKSKRAIPGNTRRTMPQIDDDFNLPPWKRQITYENNSHSNRGKQLQQPIDERQRRASKFNPRGGSIDISAAPQNTVRRDSFAMRHKGSIESYDMPTPELKAKSQFFDQKASINQSPLAKTAKVLPLNQLLPSDLQSSADKKIEDDYQVSRLKIRNDLLAKNQTDQADALKVVQQRLTRKQREASIVMLNRNIPKKTSDSYSMTSFSFSDIAKLWARFIEKVQYNHLLVSQSYEISNELGLKSIFHFKFLATCVNFYLFATALFLFPILKQIIAAPTIPGSGWYLDIFSFFSMQVQGAMLVYFGLLFLVMSCVLIIMSYYRYTHYKKNDVVFEMRESRGLKFFTMIACEYNWKLRSSSLRRNFQFSLRNKVYSSFQEEDEHYRAERFDLKQNTFALSFLFNVLFLLGLIGTCVLFTLFVNQVLFDRNFTQMVFVNEIILSGIIVAITEIISTILSFLSKCLVSLESQSKTYLSKASSLFSYQLIVYSYYIFIRTSVLFDRDSATSNILLKSISQEFKELSYECPQQAIAASQQSLFVVQALNLLLKQYIPLIREKISEQPFNSADRIRSSLKEFKIIENTAPVILFNYFVVICSLHSVVIYPISLIFMACYFFHNLWLTKLSRQPESLNVSATHTQGILVKMFIGSIFFVFVYSFFTLTIDHKVFYFKSDSSRVCGPFDANSQNVFNSLFEPITSSSFLSFIFDLILWRPLLIAIIIMLLLNSLASHTQYTKWLSTLHQRNHEINSIKKHYKKKVMKLQQKLEIASKGIEAIQSTNQRVAFKQPQETPSNNNNNINSNIQRNSIFLNNFPSSNGIKSIASAQAIKQVSERRNAMFQQATETTRSNLLQSSFGRSDVLLTTEGNEDAPIFERNR